LFDILIARVIDRYKGRNGDAFELLEELAKEVNSLLPNKVFFGKLAMDQNEMPETYKVLVLEHPSLLGIDLFQSDRCQKF